MWSNTLGEAPWHGCAKGRHIPSLIEEHAHAIIQMVLHMAMKHPRTRIISHELDQSPSAGGDNDRILERRVDNIDVQWVVRASGSCRIGKGGEVGIPSLGKD